MSSASDYRQSGVNAQEKLTAGRPWRLCVFAVTVGLAVAVQPGSAKVKVRADSQDKRVALLREAVAKVLERFPPKNSRADSSQVAGVIAGTVERPDGEK